MNMSRILRKLSCGLRLLPLAALLALAGCGPFWVNPYITVTESQLNWVEIHYYRMDRTPVRRTSVFISGTGHVVFKKGASELISNDFAKRNESEGWDDIQVRRHNIGSKHANDIFQNLVNYGLLDNEKHFKGTKTPRKDRFMGVKASIGNLAYTEQANIFEVDPDLAEQLLDVVREFDCSAL
ncbi:MAG: hypothetical protein J6U17_01825 [Kiritimatiellae bacterium]|nr:hypothetical protein [Kiritimatiellia bacterium]